MSSLSWIRMKKRVITDARAIDHVLSRGPVEIVVEKDLRKKLQSGKHLRIKHGVDPTSKDLHLGYFVVYEKLRQLQELGHQIVFMIGGFTGRFGDPTDKEKARTLRTKRDVEREAKNYLKQLSKVLDIDAIEVRNNSEWYDTWSWEQGLRFMSRFTTAQMLERDMFVKRMKAGKEIFYHEPVYPALQGWDSVELHADATVIGLDQKFNELVARDFQMQEGQAPQDLVMMPLLVGTDGHHKMSQSLGNHIGFNDSGSEMFGKVMSLPDSVMEQYFTLATRISDAELSEILSALHDPKVNPRDLKVRLASEIVTIFHGATQALKASQEFDRVFRNKDLPDHVPEFRSHRGSGIVDILVDSGLLSSRSEARRMITQGAVRLNDQKATDERMKVKSGDILRCGKRKFLKMR